MDKYLLVILGFMFVGIPIAWVNPADGTFRTENPNLPLFYGSIGGIIVIVLYSSYKERKQRQKENRERRRKSKK